jgi:hypothetical protein
VIDMRRLVHLPPRVWTDAAGAAIVLLLVAATLAESRGDRSRFLTLLLACVIALAAGRLVGTVGRVLVPVAVVATAVVVAGADLVSSRSMVGPFRSPVALAALAVIAAVMAALAARPIEVRPSWARRFILGAALAFAAVLATTIVLGATFRHEGETGGDTLQRAALWHGALEILLDHPTGVGPGRFDDVPPHYLPDGDVRWADNDFLQQGAELGWLGLVTTVLLFPWGFARAWVHPRPDAYVALGAVALAVVGILASVDHVLHIVAIPIVAAALVGSSQASGRERG